MLASADAINVVAESFRKHDVKVSVVDPVPYSCQSFYGSTTTNYAGHGVNEWIATLT